MNRFTIPTAGKEAKIRYDHADYQLLSSGTHVTCVVTGQPIPIDELKYWSVEFQEPYIDVEAGFQRHMERLKAGR